MAKTRYFILGKGCSIFFDPSSRLKVVSSKSSEPSEFKGGKNTKRMEIALKHSHIVELDGPGEEEEADDEPTTEEVVNALSKKADSLEYYKENFDVTEEDEAKFEAMTLKEQKAFLLED